MRSWTNTHAPGRAAAAITSSRAPETCSTPAASCVLVRLETGRKHQIRVQLAAAGHPLLGDRRYAPPEVFARFHRPALHAWTIALTHPVRRDELRLVAPLPADMTRLLATLRIEVSALGKNPI
jgi:23S rRNA pseudouridine1911/1915/1917 synthase